CGVSVGLAVLLLAGTGCVMKKKGYVGAGMPLSEEGAPASFSQSTAPVASTKPASVEYSTNTTSRLITYDATLRLVVQDLPGTLTALQEMAAALQGYMQTMTGESIILRIPAARLQDALEQVEALGSVTSREIKGSDVTEEMLDLEI